MQTWYVYRMTSGESDVFLGAIPAGSPVEARHIAAHRFGLNPRCLLAMDFPIEHKEGVA